MDRESKEMTNSFIHSFVAQRLSEYQLSSIYMNKRAGGPSLKSPDCVGMRQTCEQVTEHIM